MMDAPKDRTLAETEIATSWLDDDGILYQISKPPQRTIKNVTENLEAIRKLTGGKKVCVIVFVSKGSPPDQATRKFVNEQLPKNYKAMAIVSKSGVGKFIMNLLFSFSAPVIPMKTFGNVEEARAWIGQY